MTMKKLTGHEAIRAAEQDATITLHKHTDPTAEARVVTLDEAREIAKEDPTLIWCEVDGLLAKHNADRLAVLRGEIHDRLVEVQRLLGPKRAHMIRPAAEVIAKECSRGFVEADRLATRDWSSLIPDAEGKPKSPSPVATVIAKLQERAITGGWGEWFEVLDWAGVERCPYAWQTLAAEGLHRELARAGVRIDEEARPVRFRAPLDRGTR